ncbi:hypothetical protein CTI18_09730 [Prevotella intermedia]|uniref:Uncharacterized protein n=1 Tax=Prevotella intermedia TaxID=28131 RepID=A0A2G8I6V3_PREIN|nr:hypothetical protein CTI18_09730 [Prevotella intermedia]
MQKAFLALPNLSFYNAQCRVGMRLIAFLAPSIRCVHLENLDKIETSRIASIEFANSLDFVKKVLKKNDNFDFALRKRLFWTAKQPLLPCKTYAFGMQNNRFYNALIYRMLDDRHACEKYLHFIACLSCISVLPEPPITQKRKTITVLRFR